MAAQRVATLREGAIVALAGFGPVEADGLTWYRIDRLCVGGPDGSPDPERSLAIGDEPCSDTLPAWMPVGDHASQWVQPAPARCPTVPDLRSLARILPGERFECWAGETIELSGAYLDEGARRGGTVGPPRAFDPEWLVAPERGPYLLLDDVDSDAEPAFFELRFPPEVSIPDHGRDELTRMRFRGRFDDPRATSCTIVYDGVAVPQLQAILFCRQQFVVESYSVLGPASP